MKQKKSLILGAVLVVVIIIAVIVTKLTTEGTNDKEKKFTVVTSFYPVYVAAENIVGDIEGVQLVNMAGQQTGCLHDYQITTEDMKKLESADVFIMNGGGMEGFIEEVIKRYPDLKVIDTSEGIQLLKGEEHHHDHEDVDADHDHDHEDVDADHDHDHEHEDADADHDHEHEDADTDHDHEHEDADTHHDHEDADADHDHDHEEGEEHHHDHGAYNAHIWMNPDLYEKQIDTITTKLSEYDKDHANQYKENANTYKEKIEALKTKLAELKNPVNKEVIIFHDAFMYLADYLGIEVVYSVEVESESSLSSGEIAHVIDEVKLHDIKALFTEKQYKDTIANAIAKETDATVYSLDSLVTGDLGKDSYIKGMENNIEMLKEALY